MDETIKCLDTHSPYEWRQYLFNLGHRCYAGNIKKFKKACKGWDENAKARGHIIGYFHLWMMEKDEIKKYPSCKERFKKAMRDDEAWHKIRNKTRQLI